MERTREKQRERCCRDRVGIWYTVAMSNLYWLFFTLTLILTAFIGYGTFATANLLRHWQPQQNLLLLPAENGIRLLMIGLCVGLGWMSGLPRQQLGWIVKDWGQQVGMGLVLGGGMALLFYGATVLLLRHGGQRFYSPIIINAITPQNRGELLLVLLAMVPVVVLEELLFRSLLLGGFMPLLPLPMLLISWSVAFGLLHSPQGVWGMIGSGLAGLLLGLLFVWQGSLLLPIVAHYVTNGVQLIHAMRLGYGRNRANGSAVQSAQKREPPPADETFV